MVTFSSVLIVGFISLIQYYYQKGTLYRLRSLGERRNMDITVGKLNATITGIMVYDVKFKCLHVKIGMLSEQVSTLGC